MKQLGVVAFAVVLGACSKQAAPKDPNQDPASRAVVEKLEAYRDEVCACQDAACVGQVTEAREEDQQRARDVANAAFTECATKVATPDNPAAAQALTALAGLRDEMCACQDKACADRVTEKFMAMGEQHKDTKASDAQMKTAGEIAEAYGKCMGALYGATP